MSFFWVLVAGQEQGIEKWFKWFSVLILDPEVLSGVLMHQILDNK
jgi:hypothetical protein